MSKTITLADLKTIAQSDPDNVLNTIVQDIEKKGHKTVTITIKNYPLENFNQQVKWIESEGKDETHYKSGIPHTNPIFEKL